MSDLSEDLLPFSASTAVYPKVPFGTIALAFSGGGFRAASFSLGALSYLYRCYYKKFNCRLIDRVVFITSTSGGSITNASFSTALYDDPGFSFEQFYEDLRQSMDGTSLLREVLAILSHKSLWKEKGYLSEEGKIREIKKPRNLINAFAKAYDEKLLKGRTLDCIYSASHKPSLEKVAFNTTEFNNGMNFYFQVNGHKGTIDSRGNGYLKFKDPEVIRHLKISDIVAASSCFPAGFEPIIYPNDFVHEGLTDVNQMISAIRYEHNDPTKAATVINKPFALMDGGIADNMGIHCIMVEDSERVDKQKKPFDLILACDVTSYFNDPLEETESKQPGWTHTVNLKALWMPFVVAPLLLIACILSVVFQVLPVLGYLLLLPSLMASAGYWWIRRQVKKRTGHPGSFANTLMQFGNYFFQLPLSVITPMLKARLNSSMHLVTDLFLKQIRRSQYEHLFTQPVLVHRTIACLVYEFSSAHEKRRLQNLATKDKDWWPYVSEMLMPSALLQQTVNEAKAMGTTLWFDDADKEKRDKLLATGQLTLCYNLIKHIYRLESQNRSYRSDEDLQALKTFLLKDWQSFQQNPLFMVDNLEQYKNVYKTDDTESFSSLYQ